MYFTVGCFTIFLNLFRDDLYRMWYCLSLGCVLFIKKIYRLIKWIVFVVVPPMMWIPNQLVGAVEGLPLTLECLSEAYPKSINYWTREKGEIVPQGNNTYPQSIMEISQLIYITEKNTFRPIFRFVPSQCFLVNITSPYVYTYVCITHAYMDT